MATTYLEYPSSLASKGGSGVQHWISFKAFDFKSKGSQTLDIALYIPSDALQTSYKSSYEAASLGAVMDKAVSTFKDASPGTSESAPSGIESLKLLMKAQAAATGSEAGTVSLLKGAEKAAALGLGDTKTLMERSTGSVMNPYMVAAYKGPSDMREHKFSFKMLPQSESESKTCVKIVNSFKKAMLPSHQSNADTKTAPSMLFGYPDEFTIEYYIDGRALPKDKNGISNPMFNIGRSVLTACDLNYATQDVPLFFDGTQYPVSIDMQLSFMEIGVMYREKIDQGF